MKVNKLRLVWGVSWCIFAALLVIVSCRKENEKEKGTESVPARFGLYERQLLNNYLQSDFYAKLYKQYQFGRYGQLNWQRSGVSYVDDDKRKPLLRLVFTQQNRITALLQVIPVPSRFSRALPDNAHYLTGLVDYTEFDPEKKSGSLNLRDLNYEGYLAARLMVDNNTIVSRETYSLPPYLKLKYPNLMTKRELGNPVWQRPASLAEKFKAAIPCDTNGNGNLGFGECYSCFVDACSTDKGCAILCALVNLASGKTPVMAQCTLSIVAACAYLAIVY